MSGGGLVLVDVDLAVGLFGDHRSVVGSDSSYRVEVLDDLVVGSGSRFTRVGADVDEHGIRFGHDAFSILGAVVAITLCYVAAAERAVVRADSHSSR